MNTIAAYLGEKDAFKTLLSSFKAHESNSLAEAHISVLQEKSFQEFSSKSSPELFNGKTKDTVPNGGLGLALFSEPSHKMDSSDSSPIYYNAKMGLTALFEGEIANKSVLQSELVQNRHWPIPSSDIELFIELVQSTKAHYSCTLLEAVEITSEKVMGSLSMIIVEKDNHEKLIVVLKNASLFLSETAEGILVSNSASSSNKLISSNNQILTIDNKGLCQSLNIEEGHKKHEGSGRLSYSISDNKNGFAHHMLKELHEIPSLANDLKKRYIKSNDLQIQLEIPEETVTRISSSKRIIILCDPLVIGSAQLIKYWTEEYLLLPASIEIANEFHERKSVISDEDLVLVLSWTGEEQSILESLCLVKAQKAYSISFLSDAASKISTYFNQNVAYNQTEESSLLPTKTLILQQMASFLYIIEVARIQNKINEYTYWQLLAEMSLLDEGLSTIIQSSSAFERLSIDLKESKQFLFVGSGFNFPVANQAEKLFLQLQPMKVQSQSIGKYEEQILNKVESGTVIFLFANGRQSFNKLQSFHLKARRKGARLVIIANSNEHKWRIMADSFIPIPKANEALSPILSLLPLQFIIYFLAIHYKHQVDREFNELELAQ